MRYAALPILFALASCAQDPFDRPGTWSVPLGTSGANDANLRTMVVDPRDLTAGTGEDNSAGTQAVIPVRRLLTGRRPPLPQSDASSLRTGNSGGAQPGQPQTGGANSAPLE